MRPTGAHWEEWLDETNQINTLRSHVYSKTRNILIHKCDDAFTSICWGAAPAVNARTGLTRGHMHTSPPWQPPQRVTTVWHVFVHTSHTNGATWRCRKVKRLKSSAHVSNLLINKYNMSGHVNTSRVCTWVREVAHISVVFKWLMMTHSRWAVLNVFNTLCVVKKYPVSQPSGPENSQTGSEHVAQVCWSVISHLNTVARSDASKRNLAQARRALINRRLPSSDAHSFRTPPRKYGRFHSREWITFSF